MNTEQKTRPIFKQLGKISGWNPPENFQSQKDSMIRDIESELPSGSGINAGCQFNSDESTTNFIVIDFSYHYMNQDGMYDGWIEFKLTLEPDFISNFTMDLRIINHSTILTNDDIECLYFDYLYQTFDSSLRELMKVTH